MRQKCVKFKWVLFYWERGKFQNASEMRQNCVKDASKMCGTPLGENTFWTILILGCTQRSGREIISEMTFRYKTLNSEKVFVCRERVSGFPKKGADFWGSPGNFFREEKKSPNPYLWVRLSSGGVGAQKIRYVARSQANQTFWVGYPGILPGYPGGARKV